MTNGKKIQHGLFEETSTQDFKYLGSWACSKSVDIKVCKALAWQSLHKMRNIWKNNWANRLKLHLFRATVETILLYGSTSWSLTKREEQQLDGTYTRMLRMVYNINWSEKITNRELYGELEKLSEGIRRRRLSVSGHIYRYKDSPAWQLIKWIPKHGNIKRGRPPTTYINKLLREAGFEDVKDLEKCMQERDIWLNISSRRLIDTDRK